MRYFRTSVSLRNRRGLPKTLNRVGVKLNFYIMGSITDLLNEILGLVNSLLSSLGIALPVGGL